MPRLEGEQAGGQGAAATEVEIDPSVVQNRARSTPTPRPTSVPSLPPSPLPSSSSASVEPSPEPTTVSNSDSAAGGAAPGGEGAGGPASREIHVLDSSGNPVLPRRLQPRVRQDEVSTILVFDFNLRFNLSGWLAGVSGERVAGLRTGLFQLYLDFAVGPNAVLSPMVSAVMWTRQGVRASMFNVGLRGTYTPFTERLTSGPFLAGEMSYSMDREPDPVQDPFPVELFMVKGQAGYQLFTPFGLNFWVGLGMTASAPGFFFCSEFGVGYGF